ncbi:MAG TPA: SufBD protein [Candidatus Hydrogenedentes bacterium]|nr:SufBD protein [Candidatus Hydrogenedentota bacterium]
MSGKDIVAELMQSIGVDPAHPFGDDVARIEVHENRIVGVHLVPGLQVDANETDTGIDAAITVADGARIERPVHICFGVLPENGIQHINLNMRIRQDSRASFLAHCTFPNAKDVQHLMNAVIEVGPGAHYAYFERHVHGKYGGVNVVPVAKVVVHEGAEFTTEFELIKGRAGRIDFSYDTECRARSVVEMTARINGRETDSIVLREKATLIGEDARAALVTHIALRDQARAEIYNEITATGDRARGHVDCKEIVIGEAVAKAVPSVEVRNPTAHVTHEAAIGSVDSKQLQTLLSRGLNEDEATDLIVEGLLSKKTRWS